MSGESYRVIFKGEISEGENIEDVKAKLASELKVGRDKIERLFSRSAVVIKKGAKLGTCVKIKRALDRAGAISFIEKEKNVEGKTNGPTPPPIPDELISGSAASVGPPVKKADERFCEYCGSISKINSLACPACGRQFRRKKPFPVWAILGIIVGAVIAGYLVMIIIHIIRLSQLEP